MLPMPSMEALQSPALSGLSCLASCLSNFSQAASLTRKAIMAGGVSVSLTSTPPPRDSSRPLLNSHPNLAASSLATAIGPLAVFQVGFTFPASFQHLRSLERDNPHFPLEFAASQTSFAHRSNAPAPLSASLFPCRSWVTTEDLPFPKGGNAAELA